MAKRREIIISGVRCLTTKEVSAKLGGCATTQIERYRTDLALIEGVDFFRLDTRCVFYSEDALQRMIDRRRRTSKHSPKAQPKGRKS